MDPARCRVRTEHSVFRFVSLLRSSPESYVPILKERAQFYADYLYKPQFRNGVETTDGRAAVDAAISFIDDLPSDPSFDASNPFVSLEYDPRLAVLARRDDVSVDDVWRYVFIGQRRSSDPDDSLDVDDDDGCWVYYIPNSRLTQSLSMDGQHITVSLLLEDGVPDKTFLTRICTYPHLLTVGVGVRLDPEEGEDGEEGGVVMILCCSDKGNLRIRSDEEVEADMDDDDDDDFDSDDEEEGETRRRRPSSAKKKSKKPPRMDPSLRLYSSPRPDVKIKLPMQFHDATPRQQHRVRDIVDAHLARREIVQSDSGSTSTSSPSLPSSPQTGIIVNDDSSSLPPPPPLVREGDTVVDHESRSLDFKQFPSSMTFPRVLGVNEKKWRQSIASKLRDYFVAFANTVGGILLFGVTDKSLVIESEIISDELEEQLIKQFDSLIAQSVQPQVECADLQLLFIRLNGPYENMKLIALQVKKSSLFYVFKEGGGFKSYQRMTECNVQLDWNTIVKKSSVTSEPRQEVYADQRLIDSIVDDFVTGARPHQILHGPHGSGKTMLSREIACHPRITSAFVVYWISAGYRSEGEIKAEYDSFRKDRSREVLIVLDDSTHESQFLWLFDVSHRCQLLVTTTVQFETEHLQRYYRHMTGELGPSSLLRLEKELNMRLRVDPAEDEEYSADVDPDDSPFFSPLYNKVLVTRTAPTPPPTPSSAGLPPEADPMVRPPRVASPLVSPLAGEVHSMVKIMRELGVSDVGEVSATLKRKNANVYAAAHALQIFPSNVLIPLSILTQCYVLKPSDITALEMQFICEYAHRTNEDEAEVRILLRFEIESEEVLQEKFLRNLEKQKHRLRPLARDYRYQYLFYHLQRSGRVDEIVSLLRDDATEWILPKYATLRSSTSLLADFSFVNLSDHPAIKAIYRVLLGLKQGGWERDLRFSLALGLRNDVNSVEGLEPFIDSLKAAKGDNWLFPMGVVSSTAKLKRVFLPERATAFTVSDEGPSQQVSFIGNHEGGIHAYDLTRSRVLADVLFADSHSSDVTDFFVSEGVLYSCSFDRNVHEWNIATGSKIRSFRAPTGLVQVCVSRSCVFALGDEESLFCWPRSGSIESEVECVVVPNAGTALLWDSGNRTTVEEFLVLNGSEIRVYDVDRGDWRAQPAFTFSSPMWKCALRGDVLVAIPPSRDSFTLYAEGHRLGEVALQEGVVESLFLSRDHIYLGTVDGRVLKYAKKLKYMGFYAPYVQSRVLAVFDLQSQIFCGLDHHIEVVHKQKIVKRPSCSRAAHLVCRGHVSGFFSMRSVDSKVRHLNPLGGLVSSMEIGPGPKCMSRSLPATVYHHDPTRHLVVSKSFETGTAGTEYPCDVPLKFINVSGGGALVALSHSSVELLGAQRSIEIEDLSTHCRITIGRDEDFFVATTSNSVLLYRLDGTRKGVFRSEDLVGTRHLALSKDGKLLFCVVDAPYVVTISLRNGVVDRRFLHDCIIETLCVTSNNKFVITAARDHSIRVFHLRTEETLICQLFPSHVFTSLAWKPNARILCAGGRLGDVFLFEMRLRGQESESEAPAALGRFDEQEEEEEEEGEVPSEDPSNDTLQVPQVSVQAAARIDTQSQTRPRTRLRSPSFGPTNTASPMNLAFVTKIPVQRWTKRNVSDWIASIDSDFVFLKYHVLFQRHHISGEVLCDLQEAHLKEMGVTAVGHRLLILNRIKRLQHYDGRKRRKFERHVHRSSREDEVCHSN